MQFLKKYVLLVVFALFIWGLFAVDMVLPPRAFSDMENRVLAQSPAFSAKALLSNTYTLKYEEFVNDQFVGRNGWITVKSLSETALGKQENNGIVYGRDHQLFQEAATLDETQLWRNVNFIRQFGEAHPDKEITFTVIPTSYAILEEKLPTGLPVIDQKGIIQGIYRELGDSISICDIVPALWENREDYIYYRNDHHWTTLGAHLAYEEYMAGLGREPIPLDSLEAREVNGFYGTYFSKAKKWDAVPDVITWYEVGAQDVTVDGEQVDGLYNHDMWEQRDKYAAFLHGNNGLTTFAGRGEGSVLLFKDSYGNSLAPFLAESFAEIHVVDLRYYNGVARLLAENDYDYIYVLYNFDTLTQDLHLYKLVTED